MERYNPYDHAEELGIRVIHRPIRTANGMWLPDHNIIVLRTGMKAVWDRATLAHEVGHATYGHRDDRPKHEVQADRFAASNLINLEEARALVSWTQDAGRICQELGVTGKHWRVWSNLHGEQLRHAG